MSKYQSFNVNDYVKVKLTGQGKYIYYHQYDDINVDILKMRGKPLNPIELEYDDEGYVEFQFWHLMHIFGSHLFNGCDIPFETTIKLELPLSNEKEERIATDCRDCHGKLIYTGDYIRLFDDVKKTFGVEDGIVHFSRGMFTVGGFDYRHSFNALASYDYVMRGEVIGDIYNNPEHRFEDLDMDKMRDILNDEWDGSCGCEALERYGKCVYADDEEK